MEGGEKMKKFLYLLVLAIAVLAIITPTTICYAKIILRIGHTGTPQNMMHITFVHWGDLVKERTKGEVIIEVYPSEQLGNERTLLENTNLGTIEGCCSGSGGAARFVPFFGMFENAYTFKDLKHFENVCFNRPFMNKISQALEEKSNMALMGFQWLGNRSLLSKIPVKSPEDAKGLKLRVPDVPTYKVVAYALGAIPSPLPFGETYMALKQGVVDAVEGTPENMINMKFFEAAKHYTLTNHMIQASAVYLNKGVFYNKLSKEQQKIVLDSAYEAWYWFFKQNDEIQKGFIKKLEDAGNNVIRLQSTEPFRKRALEMLQEKYIPEWGKICDEFVAFSK
jgi:tripartite ATP-independent transporter DctP family solute receptor